MDWPALIWLKAAVWEVELRLVAMLIVTMRSQEYVVVSVALE